MKFVINKKGGNLCQITTFLTKTKKNKEHQNI